MKYNELTYSSPDIQVIDLTAGSPVLTGSDTPQQEADIEELKEGVYIW